MNLYTQLNDNCTKCQLRCELHSNCNTKPQNCWEDSIKIHDTGNKLQKGHADMHSIIRRHDYHLNVITVNQCMPFKWMYFEYLR